MAAEPPVATTVVRERGRFAITCKVPMSHVPLWLKDGVPVAQSQGYQLQQEYPVPAGGNNGSVGHIFMRLSVERAHLSHAGHYKCSSFSPHAHRIVVVAGKAPTGCHGCCHSGAARCPHLQGSRPDQVVHSGHHMVLKGYEGMLHSFSVPLEEKKPQKGANLHWLPLSNRVDRVTWKQTRFPT